MPEISQRLADAVEARRRELGYTPTTLAEATGLSLQALKNVRRGEIRRYQDRLTLPLTRALRWSADSIQRLIDGDDPVVERSNSVTDWRILNGRSAGSFRTALYVDDDGLQHGMVDRLRRDGSTERTWLRELPDGTITEQVLDGPPRQNPLMPTIEVRIEELERQVATLQREALGADAPSASGDATDAAEATDP